MVRHATAYSCSRDGEVVFIRYSVRGPSRWFKNLLRRKHRRRGSVRLPHHKTPTPRSIDGPSSRGQVQAVSDSSRRGIGYPKFQLFQKRPNFPKAICGGSLPSLSTMYRKLAVHHALCLYETWECNCYGFVMLRSIPPFFPFHFSPSWPRCGRW